MSEIRVREHPVGNRLLAALPAEQYARLAPHLDTVALPFRQLLYAPATPIPYVYFPTEGVCSLLQCLADGSAVEVATVGHEGLIGLPVFLGAASTPGQALVQVPGAALRLATDICRREVVWGHPLHTLVQRYTHALLVQMAQGLACNRFHPITARCARWLLQTHDHVRAEAFPLTQEFLALMLGVRRASVCTAACALQRAGLIRYARGIITIRDRQGLEAAACECYGIIQAHHDRVFG